MGAPIRTGRRSLAARYWRFVTGDALHPATGRVGAEEGFIRQRSRSKSEMALRRLIGVTEGLLLASGRSDQLIKGEDDVDPDSDKPPVSCFALVLSLIS